MEKQYSYGAVIIREKKGKVLYLIAKNYRGEWGFPKGHQEKAESPIKTAKREIFEETSISDPKFITDFQEDLVYVYEHEGQEVEKHSVYFLAKTEQEKVICQDGEHKELRWVEFNEALGVLTFDNTKSLLKKAAGFYARHSRNR